MKRGSSINSFKSLFCFLIAFRISRFLHLKLTKKEFVTPSRTAGEDVLGERKPAFSDGIVFIVLFFIIIAAQML